MRLTRINGTDAGFFSMFRGTMSSCYFVDKNGGHPYIYWKNTLYNEKKQDNAWEYYFSNIHTPSQNDTVVDFGGHILLPREFETRAILHDMVQKYAILKPYMQQNIDIELKKFKSRMLGVHIRLTDKNNCTKHGEPESGKPVSLDLYEKHIDNYLSQYPYTGIFLATDDRDCVKRISSTFPNKVVTTDSLRSSGDISVHHDRGGNKIKKGKDVLMDCYLLSKCHHLIKGISNVALCAMFINKDLTCENLNSIYNNDTREDFINV